MSYNLNEITTTFKSKQVQTMFLADFVIYSHKNRNNWIQSNNKEHVKHKTCINTGLTCEKQFKLLALDIKLVLKPHEHRKGLLLLSLGLN